MLVKRRVFAAASSSIVNAAAILFRGRWCACSCPIGPRCSSGRYVDLRVAQRRRGDGTRGEVRFAAQQIGQAGSTRRYDEAACVDFPAHSQILGSRKQQPVGKRRFRGGHDADFTQNAAEDFRGCRRRIQLRLDARAGASRNGAHRPDLRPDRSVCGGRLGCLLDRRADCDRSRQREGRHRRQVQGRRRRRRFPEQARGGDQRGGAPDRPGEDRHHQRRLCELARGPARGQGRAAEEDPLDHDRGLDRRVQGQEPAIRLPRADSFRSVRPGLCGLHRRTCQGQARHGAQGRQGRADPRRRPLWRRRRRRRRGLFQGGRPSDRAQGRLFGVRARPLGAGDQAQARPGPT